MTSSTGNDPTPDVLDLFAAAHDEGNLSQAAYQILSVPDLGAQIQAAMGVPALEVPSTRVVLLSLLLDDSGSIAYHGNEQAVRDGHNAVVAALRASRQAGDILAQCSYLNAGVRYPYSFLNAVPPLDATTFRATGGTPLYDQALVTLGGVVAKAREFQAGGVPVSTVTLIVTDGNDAGSQHGAADVAAVVADMLAGEDHVVAGMGIADGTSDFRAVFRAMGIPDAWVLTPRSDPGAIRRAFQVFSTSAVSAAGDPAALAAAGFGGFGV